MTTTYDDEIRKNAQAFVEAESLFQSAEARFDEAKRELDAAKSKRDEIKKTLASYVGRNTRRRVIKLLSGGVVVVSYEGENLTVAEIHEML